MITYLIDSLGLWSAIWDPLLTYLPADRELTQPSKQTRRRLKELVYILTDLQSSQHDWGSQKLNAFLADYIHRSRDVENDRWGRWWMCDELLTEDGSTLRGEEGVNEMEHSCMQFPEEDLKACSRVSGARL